MSEHNDQRVLTLPPLDNPEGHLKVVIEGQEPFYIPYMDYVTVDQVTEIIDLQERLDTAESPQESIAATISLLQALGLTIINKLPAGHLLAIMNAWQKGPGDLGESDGSEASLEPTDSNLSTSSSATDSGSEESDSQA